MCDKSVITTDELGGIIYCMYRVEELVAELFLKLANLENLPKDVAIVLRYIGMESRNHGLFLRSLHEIIKGRGVSEEKCLGLCGSAYLQAKKLYEKVASAKKISISDVIDILQKDIEIEYVAGEETYIRLIAPLLKSYMHELELVSKPLLTILREIAEEEKYHEELVKEVINLLKNVD
ncbi:MAG: hypothetical protein J7K21_00340 [Desulfurococcales archaeon]|nr:hypothetical protein [Desulfurococcales archaeon]